MNERVGNIVAIECTGPGGCYFSKREIATVATTLDPHRNMVTCPQIFVSKGVGDSILYCFKGSLVLGANIESDTTDLRSIDEYNSTEQCDEAGCIKCVHAYPR